MRRLLAVEGLESRMMLDGAAASGFPSLDDGAGSPLPDFQLEDVNPASARFGEVISPRDYLDQASAWYFGHAT